MNDGQERRGTPIRSISAVLSTRNEATTLTQLVDDLVEHLSDLVPDFEVLIVDGGSSDGTPRRIAELVGRYPTVYMVQKPSKLRHRCVLGVLALTRHRSSLRSSWIPIASMTRQT